MKTTHIISGTISEAYLTFVGTEYVPSRHLIREGPWIEWARRMTGRESLFVYYHRYEGTYVLADWIYRPKEGKGPGLFTEIEVLDGSPDQGRAKHLTRQYLRYRCLPYHTRMRQMAKRVKMLRAEKAAMKRESELERLAVAAHLKKKGLPEATVYDLQSGRSPYIGKREGGKSLEQMTEMIKELARRVK